MALNDTTKQYVANLVCDILEISPDSVTDTSRLTDDRNADQLVEVVSVLEKTLGITINRTDLPRMADLRGIYDVVADARRRRERGNG